MTIAPTDEPTLLKPLRLWPGVVAVVLQWLVRFVVPIVAPEGAMFAVLGGLAGGLAVVVWWLFFSRAPWSERVGAIVLMVVALLATSRIVHESIATGMMGMLLPVYAIPVLSLALVAGAVASRRLSSGPRRALMTGAILLACGVFTLLRTGGITGDAGSDFHWRWWGYSSPQLATIDGVVQILLLNGAGAISIAPADGTLLWNHSWRGDGILQPSVIAGGDVLIGTGSGLGSGTGVGMRRVAVAHGPGGWSVEERWTSVGLKPYFNDFIVHKGHAFGFDGSILACIDLEDGKRKWKGGRYGNGQFVLLADQDLLLVLSEKGELALVAAAPRPVHGTGAVPGDRGQDVEPPGAGQRRPAGSQRRGDGRVPAVPCKLAMKTARSVHEPTNHALQRYRFQFVSHWLFNIIDLGARALPALVAGFESI